MIADKEGKSVVFPSLWLSGENQLIDFPVNFLSDIFQGLIHMKFVTGLSNYPGFGLSHT
ncbi:hypothetical protein MUA02_12630 [Enterobacteriaceae bacterium H20N1]|uniref:Uncharacterized protein n=1 Tax=Dryocola boscaweniae TaxID=2925397 RepID=A0A9X2W8E0_9ENTR|nr:hypothetical protein [Dryocola boscaweniae]MCT4702705.1 hypothetical protein [Dryocola boscaweniae]MCT4715512.1 hypothetical protein [Dryocola boscaweniae]MCT4719873.1 hypothetical protein [Dryocola boscaweniae]